MAEDTQADTEQLLPPLWQLANSQSTPSLEGSFATVAVTVAVLLSKIAAGDGVDCTVTVTWF